MAKVPDSELLQRTIADVELNISIEWARIRAVLEANPNATHQQMFNEFTKVYNLLTRRHVLELQRTYPGVQVLYEIEFLGVRDADGAWVDRPAKRGRIADGSLKGDFLQLIEVKKESEILRSVPQNAQLVVNNFLKSSKLGKQIAVERYLIKWGSRKGVAFWFSAQHPVTLEAIEFEVPVGDVRISHVQSYKVMGDGIEASRLFRPPPTGGPGGRAFSSPGGKAESVPQIGLNTSKPTVKQISGPATEARALENPGTESRGGIKPQQEIRAFKEPTPRLGNTPTPSRPTPRFEEFFRPDPVDALSSNVGLKAGIEGGILELYSMQLSGMNRLAKEKADNAVRDKMGEIDDRRWRGEYVLVEVYCAEPKSRDVLGMSPDSYPIFLGVEILHAEPLPSFRGKEASMEQQMKFIRASRDGYHEGLHPGEKEGRRIPPGRELVIHDYRLYEPIPRAVTRSSDMPPDPRFEWANRMLEPKQASVNTLRGTVGRCTR